MATRVTIKRGGRKIRFYTRPKRVIRFSVGTRGGKGKGGGGGA